MKPKRSTRMGPAIRHAVRKLIDSGSALKVLIILSDGFPQDSDYGPERGNHEYGVQDTARALQEAHEKGVETFCITVDRSGHDYLRRMCPDARYLVIEEIEDLPDALTKVYQTLTA
jgi:nitric oxide reductase activation protein